MIVSYRAEYMFHFLIFNFGFVEEVVSSLIGDYLPCFAEHIFRYGSNNLCD